MSRQAENESYFLNHLEKGGVQYNQLPALSEHLLKQGATFGDLFFQRSQSEFWQIENGIIKNTSFALKQGVGVRALYGESSGFAYIDDFGVEDLQQAISVASSIGRYSDSTTPLAKPKAKMPSDFDLYLPSDHGSEFTIPEVLNQIEGLLKTKEPRLVHTNCSLSIVEEHVLIASTEITPVYDHRPLVRLNISAVIDSNGVKENAYVGQGGRYSLGRLLSPDVWGKMIEDLILRLEVKLQAKPAPAGAMPVVLASGWGGVLLHEAVGHGLEGDFNRKGTSIYSGRIGEKVASEGVTIIDQGNLSERRGSLNVDDEGTPTQENILIENGILKGYMQDRHNAGLMKAELTGNGRRESYAHQPLPRMTNTFMSNGNLEADEVIHSLDRGLLVTELGGGQVDITSGRFVFETSEAWWVEKGKKCYPVKGATLIGNGPDAMQQVSMVGNDSCLDPGIGNCGKAGQSVPVGVGQPTLRIEGLTVGGTG